MSELAPLSSGDVVEIQNLSREFGKKQALKNVTLRVPRGGVFGLIGSNGAGKTTIIKHILGSHYAQRGSVRVFGIDPVAHPVEVLGRIGYVSENRDIPDWMRVGEIIAYTQTFYPAWDSAYAEELREMFELDPNQKISTLSRGQAARVCLLLALAHRPDLLLLDEPSSGLDPVVRRDILSAIVRTIADEGRTVIFSSHLLEEVERLADRVAIIHDGEVILDDGLESLKESFHRITLRFEKPFSEAPSILGAVDQRGYGDEWTYVCRGDREQIVHAARTLRAEIVQEGRLSLDEIFVSSISR
jgi:ABC-2 type transport system ATP-binding protein